MVFHHLDLQPTLQGKWVTLRPLKTEDFDALFLVASDPLIWEQHPEPTRYQRPIFEVYFKGAMESNAAFAVLDASNGRVIGSTRFHSLAPGDESEVLIGYTFLERAYWGKAHNREMKKLLLEFIFPKVDRVLFSVGSKNIRSRKAVERIGGVRCGEKSRVLPDGSLHVDVLYQIEKANYRDPLLGMNGEKLIHENKEV